MKVIIHRGAKEIGGTCIEVISENNSRIVIDIGLPLKDRDGESFSLAKYRGNSGPELVEKGMLPDIKGFYEWDNEHPLIDGLFISHPHMDHYGLFRFVNKDVKYFVGAAAKKLIDITVLFTNMEGTIDDYNALESGTALNCGDFTITPYLMDHSAFDAYCFLIDADGKRIMYSGDFRDHGRKTKAFYWFLRNGPKHVDALLLEGTMLGRTQENIKTEFAIEDNIVDLAAQRGKGILAYFSAQNIDRLVSFYRAAVITNRIFVIDVYTAHVLNQLKNNTRLPYPTHRNPNIKVFFPTNLCRKLKNEGRDFLIRRFRDYEITKEQLSAEKNIIMMVRPSMLSDLLQIDGLKDSMFIYSMWEGYLKEKPNLKLMDYIKQMDMEFYSIHTSGHAGIGTLKRVIAALRPKEVIPIHTEYPSGYSVLGCSIKVSDDRQVLKI